MTVRKRRRQAGVDEAGQGLARCAAGVRIGLICLAFHAAWILCFFGAGHEARDFIKIGYRFVGQSNVSHVIRFDPAYRYPPNHDAPNGSGFDGQFAYYMALDYTNARYYMDEPAYRYTRVLYPVTARALALGRVSWVPVTMIVVNWLAIGLGTSALALWLKRRSCSPWLALIYGLYPGIVLALQRDLTEPLAYGLVILAVLILDHGGRHRVLWAGAAFGLAGLARQTTVVFPLCYGLTILVQGHNLTWRAQLRANRRAAASFLALSILPISVYTGFLAVWMGAVGRGALFAPLPFAGLLTSTPWQLTRQPPELLTVILPGLIWGAIALSALRRRVVRAEMVCLLANVFLFVLMMDSSTYSAYTNSGRTTTGVVVAALFCFPYLRVLRKQTRRWAYAACGLWLVILPVVVAYGFSNARV